MQVTEQPRRPARQDTFDLRDQMATEDHHSHDMGYPSDEEHSVLEDDSDGEDRDDYMDDDDGSSSLSIPNESIDFDLVYALHSFAATVDGQANVVKGDSLFLMDDSNSYWWLVRVLKTQEVGYIPAENIETPFERLARLNKHRNVDVCTLIYPSFVLINIRIFSSPQLPRQSYNSLVIVYSPLVRGQTKPLPHQRLPTLPTPEIARALPKVLHSHRRYSYTAICLQYGVTRTKRTRTLSGTMSHTRMRILTLPKSRSKNGSGPPMKEDHPVWSLTMV